MTTKKDIQKNTGTINLFKLLSRVLCKEEIDTRSLPTYVMLYNQPYTDVTEKPYTSSFTTSQLLRNFMDIRSNYSSSEDNCYKSNFVTTIYCSDLTNTSQTYNNLTLALISSDKKSILAAVTFSPEVYNTVRSGGQANIKWVLTISNSDTAISSLSEE